MRRIATGLLVVMTLIFIGATILERDHDWATWVRVTAEASMIGALADWFAVVALFRHPLGIPIPHTAIIPKRKDQIGRALGTFVQESFLTRENVVERVRAAALADRFGAWLEDPANVAKVGHQVTEGLAAIAASLDDEQLGAAIADTVRERLDALQFAPMASRALAAATADGRHQELVDAFMPEVSRAIEENRAELLEAVTQSSPWWVPRAVDEAVLDRAITVAHRFITDVGRRRDHPLRGRIDELTAELVVRLRDDPVLIAKGEEVKSEILANEAVQSYLTGLWDGTKRSILDQAEDPDSALRRRVESSIAGIGRSLRTEPELRARVEDWMERIVGELVDRFQDEFSELVRTTVDRWDAAETGEQLEMLLGRDLQFIRINGTVVGGIAGLLIYASGRLIA
jgi:uncharacterized membrane-anchored protein YjiN (DUF445 family)